MLSNHIIINVGRQLGSGGHDIGRMLALDFGAKYYDKELLNLAAKESGLSEHFFEKNDEHKSFFRSFLHLPNGMTANYDRQGFTQDSYFKFLSDAIRKAADESSCGALLNKESRSEPITIITIRARNGDMLKATTSVSTHRSWD